MYCRLDIRHHCITSYQSRPIFTAAIYKTAEHTGLALRNGSPLQPLGGRYRAAVSFCVRLSAYSRI